MGGRGGEISPHRYRDSSRSFLDGREDGAVGQGACSRWLWGPRPLLPGGTSGCPQAESSPLCPDALGASSHHQGLSLLHVVPPACPACPAAWAESPLGEAHVAPEEAFAVVVVLVFCFLRITVAINKQLQCRSNAQIRLETVDGARRSVCSEGLRAPGGMARGPRAAMGAGSAGQGHRAFVTAPTPGPQVPMPSCPGRTRGAHFLSPVLCT